MKMLSEGRYRTMQLFYLLTYFHVLMQDLGLNLNSNPQLVCFLGVCEVMNVRFLPCVCIWLSAKTYHVQRFMVRLAHAVLATINNFYFASSQCIIEFHLVGEAVAC